MTYKEFEQEFSDRGFKNWLKARMTEEQMQWTTDYVLHLLALAYNTVPVDEPDAGSWGEYQYIKQTTFND